MLQRYLSLRRLFLLMLAALGIAIIILFTRFFSTTTPEQVMVSLFDMNAPTRYAFVSDRYQAKVAIVDLYQNQQVATLPLEVKPDFWSLSGSLGQLVYSADGSNKVYLHNVTTHEPKTISVAHPISHWHYNDEQHWLFVASKDELSRIDIANGHIDTIKLEGDASVSDLIYDAFKHDLWVSDSSHHQWLVWHLSEAPAKKLIIEHSMALPVEQTTPFVLTPDGSYLVQGFSDHDNSYLSLLNLHETVSPFSMLRVSDAALVRPYSGARGRYLWAFADNGQGIRINLTDTQQVQKITSPLHKVKAIATGWLDLRLLVAGDAVAIYNTDTLEMLVDHPLQATVRDMFITADSKTALLTTDQASLLHVISIKDGQIATLELANDWFPDKVIMGATATLCH